MEIAISVEARDWIMKKTLEYKKYAFNDKEISLGQRIIF
jgi:hypothetical protein